MVTSIVVTTLHSPCEEAGRRKRPLPGRDRECLGRAWKGLPSPAPAVVPVVARQGCTGWGTSAGMEPSSSRTVKVPNPWFQNLATGLASTDLT